MQETRVCIQRYFDAGLLENIAIRVGTADRVLFDSYRSKSDPIDDKTLFDMASVTKIVVTTTLTLMALDRKLLRLEDPAERLAALEEMIRLGLNVARAEALVQRRLERLSRQEPKGRRSYIIKDVRLFLNSLDRGIRLMREAGVDARTQRHDTEEAIELTVRIPRRRQKGNIPGK